jgi:hypothetical protein
MPKVYVYRHQYKFQPGITRCGVDILELDDFYLDTIKYNYDRPPYENIMENVEEFFCYDLALINSINKMLIQYDWDDPKHIGVSL